MINKETLLFGSFSKNAGNLGCTIFNKCFSYLNLNAIYKSFSITNLNDALISAKCLGFSGFAVSMPYKKEIIGYLNEMDDVVKRTNSCNTVLISNGMLKGFNTDYYSIYEYLFEIENLDFVYILGNGAYSGNVKICCEDLKIKYEIITRENWEKIKEIEDSVIFNCTPVENISFNPSNIFIDCNINSETGKKLALKQASMQFEIYTNLAFPNIITYKDL
jgi:shikimate dehydrogenase